MPSKIAQQSFKIIDEEISFHETRLLALKSQRNSLVPILNLPVEIIGRIIKQTQLVGIQKTDTPSGFNELRPHGEWTRIMLVCRSFRAVAVALPELWVFIKTSRRNTEWTLTSLQRAKSASLVVDHEFIINNSAAHIQNDLLFDHFSRAYAARLLLHEENLEQIQAMLNDPAPHLKTLQFSLGYEYVPVLTMLPNLSSQLVELTIRDAHIQECPPMTWPAMKRLRLDFVRIEPEALCILLFNMPSLAYLLIKNIQNPNGGSIEPIPEQFLPQDRRQRVLHGLRNVVLQTGTITCNTLLHVLHASRYACHHMNLETVGDYLHWDTNLEETIIGVFEYVTVEWAHLFVEPIPPVVLVLKIDSDPRQPVFTLDVKREHGATRHPELVCATSSSVTIQYIHSLANRYQIRGAQVQFEAVQVDGISAGYQWHRIIPQLSTLWDACAPDATKFILSDCSDLSGLSDWLIERKTTPHAIKTIEILSSEQFEFDEEMIQQATNLREGGIVENIIGC
jgi:hypothetical protein